MDEEEIQIEYIEEKGQYEEECLDAKTKTIHIDTWYGRWGGTSSEEDYHHVFVIRGLVALVPIWIQKNFLAILTLNKIIGRNVVIMLM